MWFPAQKSFHHTASYLQQTHILCQGDDDGNDGDNDNDNDDHDYDDDNEKIEIDNDRDMRLLLDLVATCFTPPLALACLAHMEVAG